MSFAEAGGRHEPFAAVQQLDFSGFATAVDALATVTKDFLNNADSLRDPLLRILIERLLLLIITERSLTIDLHREIHCY